jgi:hypothetical protein
MSNERCLTPCTLNEIKRRKIMEKKYKLFIGFTVMVITVIITFAGCDLFKTDTFPSDIEGTWRRSSESRYTNTLTFTSNTLKDSGQTTFWNITDVSGDSYTISQNDNSSNKVTITIKLVGGNLEISNDRGTGQNSWNGTWIK